MMHMFIPAHVSDILFNGAGSLVKWNIFSRTFIYILFSTLYLGAAGPALGPGSPGTQLPRPTETQAVMAEV